MKKIAKRTQELLERKRKRFPLADFVAVTVACAAPKSARGFPAAALGVLHRFAWTQARRRATPIRWARYGRPAAASPAAAGRMPIRMLRSDARPPHPACI